MRDGRNTGGAVEQRYVIRERTVLDDKSWEVEFTLANRDAMGFRMLLGPDRKNATRSMPMRSMPAAV